MKLCHFGPFWPCFASIIYFGQKIAFKTKYLIQRLAFIAFQTLRALRTGDFNEKRGTGISAKKRPLAVLPQVSKVFFQTTCVIVTPHRQGEVAHMRS